MQLSVRHVHAHSHRHTRTNLCTHVPTRAHPPARNQVLMFTATMAAEAEEAAAAWLLPGAHRAVVTTTAAAVSSTVTQVGDHVHCANVV